MAADTFLAFESVAVGLLTLITVELVILLGIVARRPAKQRHVNLGPAGSITTGQALRLEVTLAAPELVAAIRDLRERMPAPAGGQEPRPPEQQHPSGKPAVVSRPGPGGQEQDRPMPPVPPVPSGRPVTLVLRNRVGSSVENSKIGQLIRLASPDDSYLVELNARLARDLVFEVADRLGLKAQLARQLNAIGNNEDPLALRLRLGPMRLDLPMLWDSRADDLDFRPIIDAFGGCPPAKLSIERLAQSVVVKITNQEQPA